jgi:spore germination cell wall hydrolase CwlJ-like protein
MARLISEDALAIVTIWQEARGEIFAGKVAVGEVIRNRAAKNFQSDGTIAGTCLRSLAFSGWNASDRSRVEAVKLDDQDSVGAECVAAWARSNGSNLTDGALSYFNPSIVLPEWAGSMTKTCTIGNHEFYK